MEQDHLMEDFVVQSIVSYLEEQGYEIISCALGRNRGIDVHAVRDRSMILVEAKGAKGNAKNGPVARDKFDAGQIRDHLGKAIVKVLELKSKHPTAELWIAHPDTVTIRAIVLPIEPHLAELGIRCVYVSSYKDLLGHDMHGPILS